MYYACIISSVCIMCQCSIYTIYCTLFSQLLIVKVTDLAFFKCICNMSLTSQDPTLPGVSNPARDLCPLMKAQSCPLTCAWTPSLDLPSDLSPLCLYVPGFTGTMCQIDIDECASTPCHNGAKCYDRPNGFECRCAEGNFFVSLSDN